MKLVKKFLDSGKLNNVTEISDDYVLKNYPIRNDVPLYMSEDLIRNGIHYWFMKGNEANVRAYLNYLQLILKRPKNKKQPTNLTNQPLIILKAGENGHSSVHVDGNSTDPDATGTTPLSTSMMNELNQTLDGSNSSVMRMSYSDFGDYFSGFSDTNEDTELNDFINDYKWRANKEFAQLPEYANIGDYNYYAYRKINKLRLNHEDNNYLYADGYKPIHNVDDHMSFEDFKNYAIPIANYVYQPGTKVGGFYSPESDKVNLQLKDWGKLQKGNITDTSAHEISHWFRSRFTPEFPALLLYRNGETELLMKAYPMVNTYPFYHKTGYDTSEREALNTEFRTFIAKKLSKDPNRRIFGMLFDKEFDKLSDMLLFKYFREFSKNSAYFMDLNEYSLFGNPNSGLDYYATKALELVHEALSNPIYRKNPSAFFIKGNKISLLTPEGYYLWDKGVKLYRNVEDRKPYIIRYPLDESWLKNLRKAIKEVAYNPTLKTSDGFLYAKNGIKFKKRF